MFVVRTRYISPSYTRKHRAHHQTIIPVVLFSFCEGDFYWDIFPCRVYKQQNGYSTPWKPSHIGPGFDAIGRKREGTNMILFFFCRVWNELMEKVFSRRKMNSFWLPSSIEKLLFGFLSDMLWLGWGCRRCMCALILDVWIFFCMARKKCALPRKVWFNRFV